MPYIIHRHPAIRIDLVMKKVYWPKMAGIFQRCGCTYEREDPYELRKKGEWIRLVDIRGEKGWQTGALISLFYSLEWDALGSGQGLEDKFYILVNPRRKEKKHVRKDRKEAGAGSEGGDRGEPAGDIRPGQDL